MGDGPSSLFTCADPWNMIVLWLARWWSDLIPGCDRHIIFGVKARRTTLATVYPS